MRALLQKLIEAWLTAALGAVELVVEGRVAPSITCPVCELTVLEPHVHAEEKSVVWPMSQEDSLLVTGLDGAMAAVWAVH